MNRQKMHKKLSVLSIIEDIALYLILIPLVIISVMIIYQKITEPDKIPDIFGYKMFIVLDGNMDESIEYGDLVFTYNTDTKDLKLNDLIAFRNRFNVVTLHRIMSISEKNEEKTFTMKTVRNETNDTKYAKEENVEGLLVNKIPKVGLIILYIQEPLVLAVIIIFILIIGLIAYYIAQELDKRDMKKIENDKLAKAEEKIESNK